MEPPVSTPDDAGTSTELETVRPAGIVLRPREAAEPAYTDADYTIGLGTAAAIAEAGSANTRRSYGQKWRHYTAWCAEHGRVALPATPLTLIEYTRHLQETPVPRTPSARDLQPRSPTSISATVAAIRTAHTRAGYEGQPQPTKELKDLLRGYRREWAEAGGRVQMRAPLAGDALEAVLAQCAGEGAAAVRDRAMILTGVYGMLRGGDFSAFTIADLEEDDPYGVILHLRWSKTDQDAKGDLVKLPHDGCGGGTCPACCVKDWVALLAARGITTGPLFRGTDRNGRISGEPKALGRKDSALCQKSVDRRVRLLALKAGLKSPSSYGSHSLRAGGATAAALAGVAPSAIAEGGRWKPGSAQVMRYIRRVDWDNHPMKGIRTAWAAKKAAQEAGG